MVARQMREEETRSLMNGLLNACQTREARKKDDLNKTQTKLNQIKSNFDQIEKIIKDFFNTMILKNQFSMKSRINLKRELLKRKENPFDNPFENWHSIVLTMESIFNLLTMDFKPHVEVALIFCHLASDRYEVLKNLDINQKNSLIHTIFKDMNLLECYFQKPVADMIHDKMFYVRPINYSLTESARIASEAEAKKHELSPYNFDLNKFMKKDCSN